MCKNNVANQSEEAADDQQRQINALTEQVETLQKELAEARGVLRDYGCECPTCQKRA